MGMTACLRVEEIRVKNLKDQNERMRQVIGEVYSELCGAASLAGSAMEFAENEPDRMEHKVRLDQIEALIDRIDWARSRKNKDKKEP